MKLNELKIGQSAYITTVEGQGATRQHFLDLGIIPGMEVTLVKYAPMNDPIQVMVSGYELTIRLDDAKQIGIKDVHTKKQTENTLKIIQDIGHPRLGETYDTQAYRDEHNHKPKTEGKLVFALAGNQNCGKTTLFNQLTGSNQHVGNFPGVTVDRKSGSIIGHPETEVVDLPGIYSLSPYTSEEIVSRKFILEEKPTAIINIVDATNIERNLYLTLQLLELGKPMVIALNMMDELSGNGGVILINKMEEILQVPVIPISAAKNQGIHELIEHALHIATYQECPARDDFCDKNDHGGAVHRAIHGIMSLIEDHAERADLPVRFAASKLIEKDELIENQLALSDNEKDMVQHIISQMETERGLDRAAAIADMRYTFIRSLCNKTVVKPHISKEQVRSEKIDAVLTGKWTAIPVFVLIMACVFYGQAFKKNRFIGKKYCAYVNRVWMHSTSCHVHKNSSIRQRQKDYKNVNTIHVLFCQNACLWFLCQRFLSSLCRSDHDSHVLYRYSDGYSCSTGTESYYLYRRSRTICHGITKLSYSFHEVCHTAHVGKSKRLSSKSFYRHFPWHYRCMVLTELRLHYAHGRTF